MQSVCDLPHFRLIYQAIFAPTTAFGCADSSTAGLNSFSKLRSPNAKRRLLTGSGMLSHPPGLFVEPEQWRVAARRAEKEQLDNIIESSACQPGMRLAYPPATQSGREGKVLPFRTWL